MYNICLFFLQQSPNFSFICLIIFHHVCNILLLNVQLEKYRKRHRPTDIVAEENKGMGVSNVFACTHLHTCTCTVQYVCKWVCTCISIHVE